MTSRLPPQPRLDVLYPWLDHIQELGATALYLGPLFESSAHGYDTADYYHVDRRLGTRQTLAAFSKEIHQRGMRLVLDGVFNHVGRDFWAFRDVLANREQSAYTGWFANLNFQRSSPYHDPFSYEGWSGNYDLVKLNLAHPDVRRHLLDAVRMWVDEFDMDGIRLDAADQVSPDFLRELSAHCRSLRSDFWLMGEMVGGDYRRLAAPGMLDLVTNYEGYKGLYSSHADRNYFEIAYSLNRQFGPVGIYRDLHLYSFADNHDVNRVASSLKTADHLFPLYCLLFTMPGIPSIYYGSEWGLTGARTLHSDAALRPVIQLSEASSFPRPDLPAYIARLAAARRASPALQDGEYSQLHVSSEQFAFLRAHPAGDVVTAVNASAHPVQLSLRLPQQTGWLEDLLEPGKGCPIIDHYVQIDPLPANGGRVWVVREG